MKKKIENELVLNTISTKSWELNQFSGMMTIGIGKNQTQVATFFKN
jgi:hypothetical protein